MWHARENRRGMFNSNFYQGSFERLSANLSNICSGYRLLGRTSHRNTKLNDCIRMSQRSAKRYYKLILMVFVFSILLYQLNILYGIKIIYYLIHHFSRVIKDRWIERDGWKNAFFPPPLKMFDPNEFSCSDRPDIGPIDAVYTWVNGSDPKFIESMLQNLQSVDQVAAKETQSKRFYG